MPWLLLGLAALGSSSAAETIRVFAATSTTEALNEVSTTYEALSGLKVVAAYAASSVLARQIEAGAPADLFLSAHPSWTDHLERKGRLAPGSRVDLLGNDLVLVSRSGGAEALSVEGELRRVLLADGPLAIADPDHVPAGVYGKAALEHFGLWTAVADRAARAVNVRAAMALVARGESPAGIGYATDSAPFTELHVLAMFPPESHPPIVYPLAIVAGRDTPAVRDFRDFLTSPAAAEIFSSHGFRIP